MEAQFPAGARIPPFRDERRWGDSFAFSFTPGVNLFTDQLISVNETPSRVWDLLLVVEAPTGEILVVGSRIRVTFEIIVGVGSSTAKFSRLLFIESASLDDSSFLGRIETLVLPTTSFVVNGRASMTFGGGQTLPVHCKIGAFAAPRVPFLASLESAEFQEGE